MNDICRKTFEEWCRKDGQTGDIANDPNGRYFDSTNAEWKAWQSAWNGRVPAITDQPDECSESLDHPFERIWKGLEKIQHKLNDKYHFDLAAIKKVTADTHAFSVRIGMNFTVIYPSGKLCSRLIAVKRLRSGVRNRAGMRKDRPMRASVGQYGRVAGANDRSGKCSSRSIAENL